MPRQPLADLFNPSSIAVIGASNRPNSVGMKVFKNLVQGNFRGKLYPVNPKHKSVQGRTCFPSVKGIKQAIDLAVITTPAITVPAILAECGEKGITNAIVISAGFSETGKAGGELEQAIVDVAMRYNIRFIGPNCLGVMRPSVKMNATFDNNTSLPGDVALVSQSGALCAAILDWSINKKIGFSTIISLGNSAVLDFGEVLDYLAADPKTKSILLYIEGIHHSKRFMASLRAAARVKPVLAIKAGRQPQGSRAALSHTGALIGDDDVFNLALQSSGAVRVTTIEELFLAAQMLASDGLQVKGNRLVIVSNGGGAGVMAADCAADLNLSLAPLGEGLTSRLNEVLPANWSHQNPVDIIGDATPGRYHAALDILSKDKNIDGLLVILVPVSMVQPLKVAEQLIKDVRKSEKPILACWMGEKHVQTSWKLFQKNKIAFFDTPEKAVQAFSYLAEYHQNQKLLSEVPEATLPRFPVNITSARSLIATVAAEKRKVLTAFESKGVLQAFGIPVVSTIAARNKEEAIGAAKALGFPVVMKINSPDISHKQDVGGVRINLLTVEEISTAFDIMLSQVSQLSPQASILGVTIEPMISNPNDRELMIGIIHDKVFGPVISFGAGGSLVELIKDRALALPPLSQKTSLQLIEKTRMAKLLGTFRHMPPVNKTKLIEILLRISQMIGELPMIQEMDINPLVINDKEATVVDARIVIRL